MIAEGPLPSAPTTGQWGLNANLTARSTPMLNLPTSSYLKTTCARCGAIPSRALSPMCRHGLTSSEWAWPVPIDQILCLLEWVRRARAAGLREREIEIGLDEIFKEFRTGGPLAGAAFLNLWSGLLREQCISERQ